MPTYIRADVSPAINFFFLIPQTWVPTAITPTSFVLVGQDGSITTVTGTGFTFSGNNATGGTITGLTRHAPNGTTLLDSMTGLNLALIAFQPRVNADLTGFVFAGDDVLTASSGNSVLEGRAGNDTVNGGAGADTLFGGDGDDHLFGGAGNDRLVNEAGNDSIDGGADGDRLVVTVLGPGGNLDLSNTAGPGSLVIEFGALGRDTLTGIEILDVTLGSGNDVVIGSSVLGVRDSITAADGNDQLSLRDGDDDAFGGNGNDRIEGEAGNDRIMGGSGEDTLIGGAGDDEIAGDGGADGIFGGDGDDVLHALSSDTAGGEIGATDSLYGGTGDDYLFGGTGPNSAGDMLYGGTGNDLILAGFGTAPLVAGGNDRQISYSLTPNVSEGHDTVFGGAGVDQFWRFFRDSITEGIRFDGSDPTVTAQFLQGGISVGEVTGVEGFVIRTGGGNDTLVGGAAADNLSGRGGDDLLYGGQSGRERLAGWTGNDTLHGNAGDDILQGQVGRDLLFGGAGNDLIETERMDLVLSGVYDQVRDTAYGGDGNDTIVSGGGNDILDGGAGTADVLGLQFNSSVAFDQDFTTMDPTQTAFFTAAGFSIRYTGFEVIWFRGSDKGDRLRGVGNSTLEGGKGADTLFGDVGHDLLYGYRVDVTGDDSLSNEIYGGLGNDTIYGGLGDDSLEGGAGDDRITDTGGASTLFGGAGNDNLYVSGAEADTVQGGTGNDFILSSLDLSVLSGDAGDDQLTGGNLSGGAGDDLLVWTGARGYNPANSAAANTLSGGIGTDHLTIVSLDEFSAEAFAHLSGVVFDGRAILRGGGPVSVGYVVNGLSDTLIVSGVEGITMGGLLWADSIRGSQGDDLLGSGLVGAQLASEGDTIRGEGGNDTIGGTLASDVLDGGLGRDMLDMRLILVDLTIDLAVQTARSIGADLGVDVVTGFEDAWAGSGNDTILGLTGASRLIGNGGNDRIDGRAGNDHLDGGQGNDSLIGGTGIDTAVWELLEESTGRSVNLSAMLGNGALLAVTVAGLGRDTLRGIEQAEVIMGWGNDTLTGSGGNDTLDGGDYGADRLTGGAGADAFQFSPDTLSRFDTITDYVVAEDSIRLDRASFAALTLGTLAAPAFASNLSGLATTAAHRIVYERDSGVLWYDADGSANSFARVQIAALTAGLGLTAAEFLVY